MSRSAVRFFIIGAPKCGTTSLSKWLGFHPEIFMPSIKEPHYYSSDLSNRVITKRLDYQALFKNVTCDHKAVGEASTWYLFSRCAVEKIERENPNARYIVMTRDPVSMALSLYHHNRRVLYEDQPTFKAAWHLQEKRLLGYFIPKDCPEPLFLQYFLACKIGSLMQRLYEQVSAQRVLHVPMEFLRHDPAQQYERVLAHLGVRHDGRVHFPLANAAMECRSRTFTKLLRLGGRVKAAAGVKTCLGIGRLNEKRLVKPALSPGFGRELEDTFSVECKLRKQFMTVRPYPFSATGGGCQPSDHA